VFDGGAAVERIGDVGGLQDQIDEALAADQRVIRLVRPPHGAADPREPQVRPGRDRPDQARVRIGAVEYDAAHIVEIDDLVELPLQPALPGGEIAVGIGVERYVLGRVAETFDRFDALAHRGEDGRDALGQPARHGKQPRDMPQADAVGRHEEDAPRPVAPLRPAATRSTQQARQATAEDVVAV